MNYKIYKKSNILELIVIFSGFGTLIGSSSFYIPYLLVFLLSVLSVVANVKIDKKYSFSKKAKGNLIVIFFAVIFSFMILLSNYDIYINRPYINGTNYSYVYLNNTISFISICLGSFIGIYNILFYMKNNSKKLVLNDSIKQSPFFIFIFSFIVIFIINVTILYNAFYPGVLTGDSLLQVTQTLYGNYTNHHPYYHTLIIKLFVDFGISFFNDINTGIFYYCIFQTAMLASAFSLSFSTLDRVKISRKYIYIMLFLTIIMPYNIYFSFTVWKDVIFACFVLYYIIFLYRTINKLGNTYINILMFIISSLGFCLFRSNGFFAYVLSTLLFIILLGKNNKKLVLLMILAVISSYALKGPFLEDKKIPPPDTIESLAIPSQQISRVIVENGKISSDERELIDKVIDIEKVPKLYLTYISDPIKFYVRKKENQDYIKENKDEFIKLYISLGLKNPTIYIKAWVDQTEGYWNSGYKYWYYSDIIINNKLNVKRTANNHFIFSSMKSYAELFANHPLLRIFISIGAAFWSILLMLFISICKKRKLESFLTIPIVMIVASLLIATPVAYEFRYAYSVFVVIPFIMGVSLRKDYITENKNK